MQAKLTLLERGLLLLIMVVGAIAQEKAPAFAKYIFDALKALA